MVSLANISIVGDYGKDIENKLDGQRTINMYVRSTPEGKSKAVLCPMPGLQANPIMFADLNEVRSLFSYKDKLYAVVSNKIFTVSSTNVKVELGEIQSNNGYVGVDGNVKQIMWVDGSKGYIYDTSTSSFSTVTAAGFPSNPCDVSFIDGYFIVTAGQTNRFYVSALNDGLTWDALNFEGIQSRPDIVIGVRTLHRRIFLFGKKSTEVWYDAGASDFPFRRDNNMLLEYGCAAAGSIATGHQLMLWLAGDENGVGSVVMTDGTTPVAVSTPAVDYAIQNMGDVSDMKGTIYKIDGHVFYELSSTLANRTFVFDVTEKTWLEKQTLNKGRSVVNCHAFSYKKHFVGAYNEGAIYVLDPFAYTDNGAAIRRERITGHFSTPHLQQIRITRLTIDIVAGVGLPAKHYPSKYNHDHYDEPQIYLSWSKDGGDFYGNEQAKSMGKIGDRTHRCIWKRLGVARDWVFKVEVMSKNKVFILGCSVEYEVAGR